MSRPAAAKWHFQTVHHPIWGFDIASPPILADVTIGGQPRQSTGAAW